MFLLFQLVAKETLLILIYIFHLKMYILYYFLFYFN